MAFGTLMESLLFTNLLWSCYSTFDCWEFWPTISYMACYRGHDRLFNFTITLAACVMPVFFVCCFFAYAKNENLLVKVWYLLLGILISLALPFIGLIDEANSSHILPLQRIHLAIMIGIICAVVLWVLLTIDFMKNLQYKELQRNYKFIHQYVFVGFTLLFLTVIQWYFAYQEDSHWWATQNIEAAFEWGTVTMTVFLPYVFSLGFPELSLSFGKERVNKV